MYKATYMFSHTLTNTSIFISMPFCVYTTIHEFILITSDSNPTHRIHSSLPLSLFVSPIFNSEELALIIQMYLLICSVLAYK